MTERTLGAKAGHLELLKGGRKNKDKVGKGKEVEVKKGGSKKFGWGQSGNIICGRRFWVRGRGEVRWGWGFDDLGRSFESGEKRRWGFAPTLTWGGGWAGQCSVWEGMRARDGMGRGLVEAMAILQIWWWRLGAYHIHMASDPAHGQVSGSSINLSSQRQT
jgi:hypothetical protein